MATQTTQMFLRKNFKSKPKIKNESVNLRLSGMKDQVMKEKPMDFTSNQETIALYDLHLLLRRLEQCIISTIDQSRELSNTIGDLLILMVSLQQNTF